MFKKTGLRGVAVGSTLSLMLISIMSVAEEVYKVMDEEGNVTYSTEPPENNKSAEVIEAMPEPSEKDIEAARQRQQKIEEDFDKLDQARAEQARIEAEQRANTTTTVVQTNTILGVNPWHRHPHNIWWGASVAPGAPTAPGFRPPHHRPPHHRPKPRKRTTGP